MATLNTEDLEIVRRAPLFAGLPDAVLGRLIDEARVVEHARGRLLFLRGEPADRFYLLLDGWVKVYRDTPEGEQTVLGVMKPGETVAEAAIFMQSEFPASAEVVENARLLEIPAHPFITLLRDDNDLAIRLLGALSLRLRRMVVHIEQLQARSTSQRLGDFLLSLCEGAEGKAEVRLPYDKTLVAARLGMKPESLSRALAKLRTFGVATRGNAVELTDIENLREHCRSDD